MQRWITLLLLGLVLVAPGVEAAITIEWAVGASATGLSTELTGVVANGYTVAGPVIDNRIGQTGNGYTRCRVQLAATWGSTPTTPSAILVWFLKTVDAGATYEPTPTATTGPYRLPDVVLPAIPGGATTKVMVDTWCPPERFKLAARNDSTGQTLSAGSTVTVLFYTPQGN